MTPVLQYVIGQFPHIGIVIYDKDGAPFFGHDILQYKHKKDW